MSVDTIVEGVSKADPAWITAHWSSDVELVRVVSDILLSHNPNVELNHAALNLLLKNFVEGWLDLWISYKVEKGITSITGGLIASKYIGVPSHLQCYHILAMNTFETTSPKVVLETLLKLLKHTKISGCAKLTANTSLPALAKLTESTGGQTSIHCEWELI